MVYKPKKKIDKPVKEDLKKVSIAELRKKIADEEASLKSLQEDAEEVDEEPEETVEELEEGIEEDLEEQQEEAEIDEEPTKETEQEIKPEVDKRVNLTPGEIVAAIEFNINQANNLLQLLK